MDLSKLIPNVVQLYPRMITAFQQTLTMVSVSFLISGVIGLVLGVLLVATKNKDLSPAPVFYNILSTTIDLFRSTPTLILITAIGPFTKIIMGTKIGVKGAVVPLVAASAPFLARQIEAILYKVDTGVIEGAKSMGVGTPGLIIRVVLPEAFPGLIGAYTLTFVSLINFSAIAGAVGGGGLGDFALIYGYQQFKSDIMVCTIIILLAMVWLTQLAGRILAKAVRH